jgi:hypothetical protein
MLTEKATERKSQPQMKKKGKALLAGFFRMIASQCGFIGCRDDFS